MNLSQVPFNLRDPKELLHWAEQHGVADALEMSVGELAPDFPEKIADKLWMAGMWRLPLSNLITHALTRPAWYGIDQNSLKPLRDAAWNYLCAQAESVRVALEEEAAAARRADPKDPTLKELADQLSKARQKLRQSAMPRPRQSLAGSHFQFVTDPVAFVYEERPVSAIHRYAYLPSPRVTLSLVDWRNEGPRLACSCTPGAEEVKCKHVLTALDLALDRICDASSGEEATRIAVELNRPPWSRALAKIDEAHAKRVVNAASPRVQIGWTLFKTSAGWGLSPWIQKRLKRGGYSKPNTNYFSAQILRRWGNELPSVDRKLLESNDQYQRADPDTSDLLIGHPRVTLGSHEQPVRVQRGHLTFDLSDQGDAGFTIAAKIGAETISILEAFELFREVPQDGSTVWVGRDQSIAYVVRCDPQAMDWLETLANYGAEFPANALEEVVRRFGDQDNAVALSLPENLRGEERPPNSVPSLKLRSLLPAGVGLNVGYRPIEGGAFFPPGAGALEALGFYEGKRAYARRDSEREIARAEELLAALPLAGAERQGKWELTFGRDEDALLLVEALQKLPASTATVEWLEGAPRVTRPARPEDLRVRIEDRRGWFGLSGEVDVDGERVQLALLLDAVRRGQKYVRISGAKWVAIAESLRERLERVADVSFEGRNGLETGPAAVSVLDDLEKDGATLHVSKTYASLLRRIRSAQKLEPALPPLTAKLRDYQMAGFSWLARLDAWGAGACLADDMGLGKTLQALAILVRRAKDGPALVVAPTSVCFNWVRETERFAPSLHPILYHSADRGSAVDGLCGGEVLIISYGLLAREIERLKAVPFATLVLDEAQAVKNAATLRAKAARELNAEFRIALTGTPLENHLGELWSLFRIVFPGLLGSWEQFSGRFAVPIEKNKDVGRRAALARTLRPFLLRRTKDEVAKELPRKMEIQVPIVLSEGEWRIYDDARLAALAHLAKVKDRRGAQQHRFDVLAAITRLRLIACHPKLYDSSTRVNSSKLERFLEIVSELVEEGHRALVFSQFTSHLSLVKDELSKRGISYLYLDGSTPQSQRGKLVDEFQAGKGSLFLISLKAGGTGLNLTGADYVIHLDPWWNPAVEDQATDRAHRIGQTRPVTVYRLVSSGTIEEEIVRLHETKRELVNGILEGADAAGRLSTEELVDLIQFSGKDRAVADDGGEFGEEIALARAAT